MKKNFLFIMLLLSAQILTGQNQTTNITGIDPLCRMVLTMYNLDAMSFRSQHREKKVFEYDTSNTSARVMIRKEGSKISFLQIIPDEGRKELLYFQDTAWVADHQLRQMEFIGTSIDDLGQNHLSTYAPLDVFAIDTNITQVDPFWIITDTNNRFTTVSITVKNLPKEITEPRVEYKIGRDDFLIYGVLKEFLYMNADKIYEELTLSEYSFPEPGLLNPPEYVFDYSRKHILFETRENDSVITGIQDKKDIFLEVPVLTNLDGIPFQLPDEGLVFLDLWYVGCSPCMKSAPVIEKIYHQYKDRVYFYSINEVDQDTARIINFCSKMGITMSVLLGEKKKISGAIPGVSGYPVFILMDAESRQVLWYMYGFAENLEDLILEAIFSNM